MEEHTLNKYCKIILERNFQGNLFEMAFLNKTANCNTENWQHAENVPVFGSYH